jgi:hypothetical protein
MSLYAFSANRQSYTSATLASLNASMATIKAQLNLALPVIVRLAGPAAGDSWLHWLLDQSSLFRVCPAFRPAVYIRNIMFCMCLAASLLASRFALL